MQSLDDFIAQGAQLVEAPRGSQRVKLWQYETEQFLKYRYGADYASLFRKTYDYSFAVKKGMDFQHKFENDMRNGVEFLKELRAIICKRDSMPPHNSRDLIELEHIIDAARQLRDESFSAPKVDLWKMKTSKYVLQNYGKELQGLLEHIIYYGSYDGADPQDDHEEAMNKAIELLEAIKVEPKLTVMGEETQVNKNAKREKSPDFEAMVTYYINGPTIIGNGNQVSQVSVKNLVESLAEEIREQVPASAEKNKILSALKEITTNDTFAAVAGSFVGSLIGKIVR